MLTINNITKLTFDRYDMEAAFYGHQTGGEGITVTFEEWFREYLDIQDPLSAEEHHEDSI